MLRGFEREHVRHFVPQRAAPVELARGAPGGAVHRDEVAEGHTEKADAGQCRNAHREVIVIRV